MMNLLPLALLCLLISTAGAIQCQTCSNANCLSSTPVTCATETMCITTTALVTQLSGTSLSTTTMIYKACAPPTVCSTTGNETFAVDESIADVLINARCCNTDDCNAETLAAPVKNETMNGNECHFCFRTTCDIIVRCRGNEDRCFEGKAASGGTVSTIGGCVSQNVCNLSPGLWTSPIVQTIANVTAVPTCCSGSLCNTLTDTPTTAASAANATTAAPGAGNAATAMSGTATCNATMTVNGTNCSAAAGEVTIQSHFIRLSMTQVFLGLLTLILW